MRAKIETELLSALVAGPLGDIEAKIYNGSELHLFLETSFSAGSRFRFGGLGGVSISCMTVCGSDITFTLTFDTILDMDYTYPTIVLRQGRLTKPQYMPTWWQALVKTIKGKYPTNTTIHQSPYGYIKWLTYNKSPS
jgi:hypothetical protein